MNPEELFKIQSKQMLQEVEKIQWIAKNSQRLIQELFLGVQQANLDYTAENKAPNTIFRGEDFKMDGSNERVRLRFILGPIN